MLWYDSYALAGTNHFTLMFAAATVERNKRSASSVAQGERAQQRAAAALETLTDSTINCLNSSVSRIFRKQTEIYTLVTKLEV